MHQIKYEKIIREDYIYIKLVHKIKIIISKERCNLLIDFLKLLLNIWRCIICK